MTLPMARLFRYRLCTEQSGVAAVEFALILPIMLLIYFGSVEITQAVIVNRLVALTATTVTNITSQYTTISANADMPDILNASAQVLSPYPSSGAKVVISLIAIDGKGTATVSWSKALNGSALIAGQPFKAPAALSVPNTTLVYGQVTYSYSPAFDFMKAAPFSLSSSVYMSPRNSTTINLVP